MNEAESQIRAAVAAAPMILFALDRQGIFTVCEGKALALLGLTTDDAIGRSVFDAGAPQLVDAFRRALRGEVVITTVEINGLVFDTRCAPQHDAQGAVEGVVGVASNVTASARLVNELDQANRFKSDMVAIIAHELRTPLNAIMGYTDLLLEGEFGPLTAEQTEISRRVDRSAQVLRDIVAGTLELSRLDSGHLPLSLRDCDLIELMHEVDAETCEQRAKPGVTFRWQTPPRLPHLRSDPLKIKMILKNLIANAVKFTQRGEISVVATAQADGVAITVADSGIGIGADIMPHIFEPFRQGERHATRRFGGVGLGLYLVRRLVEVLGGTVDVESTRGRGSVFRVWLPLIHPARSTPTARGLAHSSSAFNADHAA